MQITLFDHIAGAYYGDLRMDDSIVEQIVDHTEETWQPDRRDEERGSNTRQGKVAEEIVEQFFLQFLEDKIAMKSYDDIRNDDFESEIKGLYPIGEGAGYLKKRNRRY